MAYAALGDVKNRHMYHIQTKTWITDTFFGYRAGKFEGRQTKTDFVDLLN